MPALERDWLKVLARCRVDSSFWTAVLNISVERLRIKIKGRETLSLYRFGFVAYFFRSYNPYRNCRRIEEHLIVYRYNVSRLFGLLRSLASMSAVLRKGL
jgi:hypothetical protein